MDEFCPNCRSKLNPLDAQPHLGTEVCRDCGGIFHQPPMQLGGEYQPITPQQAARLGMFPKPTRFVLDDEGSALTIRGRWDPTPYLAPVVLFAFSVVTLLYLAWQASPILAAGNGWPLLQHALPAAAGIALLTLVSGFYSLPALNLWRDEYLITVDPQCITLDMGPLPGKPHARFEHLELERLVVVQRQRKPLALPETFTYDLLALMSDGKQTKLAQGLRRPDEAIYIMQQVETLLQIENPE